MSATITTPARAAGSETTEAGSAVGQSTPPVPAKSGAAAQAAIRSAAVGAASWLWKATGVLAFLALWELGPLYLAAPSTRVFLPPLHEVLLAGARLLESGSLQGHLAASLARSVAGFGIALVSGVSLGLLIAWYGRLNSVLNPLLELFRNTAALALLPVFTLLLGIGEESKVTIVAYAAFFPVLLNTIAGVKTVDPLLIRAAKSLGLNSFRLFQKVILPSAVPTIFTGIRMAGTASILVLIAAEMVGAKAGLGYLIINAQSSFLIPDMYAGILTVSLLGLAVNFLLVALERHFSRWRTAVGA
ncbi:ABC transporter permease [Pseudarthrobacter sp. J75]|uniref:ABC transporter permease n=1 Tax=unclassified Pseudarthrobacter TaxID=2647000 RepID=UPI002E820C01|nr:MULTISPECIES: ABC transporter permease [unclassified Pseudarthrobacter]MEE2521099.1 ABC transporter permease [Pseudarthrobacter sp. J47]MEE2528329.1 ABC transporter permease [Pseudarthrobacter sp. J75]